MRRGLWLPGVALFVVLTSAPAVAGGWAIATLDEAPMEFVAGETYQLEYRVLQHGETPFEAELTGVVLRSTSTGEERFFEGKLTEITGSYEVELIVPEEGSWEWAVTMEPFDSQQLGRLPIVTAANGFALTATDTLKILLPLATLAAAFALTLQVRELRADMMGSTQPERV